MPWQVRLYRLMVILKSHKGSQIFEHHQFPYYNMMYELLGRTPISGVHRIGKTTTKRRAQDTSPTPLERWLDRSISEKAPEEHQSQVMRYQSKGNSKIGRLICSGVADSTTCIFSNR